MFVMQYLTDLFDASAIYSEQRMSSPSDQCMTRDVATPVSNEHRFAVAPHTEAALNCFGGKLIRQSDLDDGYALLILVWVLTILDRSQPLFYFVPQLD